MTDTPRAPKAFVIDSPEAEETPQRRPRAITGISFEPELDEGELIVMPHSDPAVIRRAKELGMASCPGVATPTEAFAALAAGADVLKMFPAEQLGPAVLKAWRAVMRPPIALAPVGGITPDNIAIYAQAGASGFGLGSALYKPGLSAAQVGQNARAFIAAWQRAYPAQETQA